MDSFAWPVGIPVADFIDASDCAEVCWSDCL